MPKVSVIIPVYNAKEHVQTSIESILAQTEKDIEVIVVDDHSTDGSIAYIKDIIRNTSRESVFRFVQTEKNAGPGAARNTGISIATGEYVAFLDSDDRVSQRMYETLYNEAIKYDADLCCCNGIKDFGDRCPNKPMVNPQFASGIFTDDDRRHFLTHFVSYFTTFIYKREMLQQNNILFPPERTAEDTFFLTLCILTASKVSSVRETMYHYIISPLSVSQRTDTERYLSKISVFKRLTEETKNRKLYEKFGEEIDFIFIKKGYMMALLEYIKSDPAPKKEIIESIKSKILCAMPLYTQNTLYRNNIKLRLLEKIIANTPEWGLKMLHLALK